MLYWIDHDPVDAADRLAAKPELAEKFYFHYERQETSETSIWSCQFWNSISGSPAR